MSEVCDGEKLPVVPVGNKAQHLLSVNHSAKAIHQFNLGENPTVKRKHLYLHFVKLSFAIDINQSFFPFHEERIS